MTEKDYVRKLTQAQKLIQECTVELPEPKHRSVETVAWQRSLLFDAYSKINEALMRGPTNS